MDVLHDIQKNGYDEMPLTTDNIKAIILVSEHSLSPPLSISIYIYIYKSKDLVRESLRVCHVTHSMKRIEIPLSHIRDKNKFKSGDSSFPLVQCFKTIFVTLLFNVLRLLIVSFGTTFQDFSSHTHTHTHTHTQKPLFISIHHFHFYSFIYTCP